MAFIKRRRWISGILWVITIGSDVSIALTENGWFKIMLLIIGNVSLYYALHFAQNKR